jgi:hypothetical protein
MSLGIKYAIHKRRNKKKVELMELLVLRLFVTTSLVIKLNKNQLDAHLF